MRMLVGFLLAVSLWAQYTPPGGGGGAPSGAAGGGLTGTYPNPTLVAPSPVNSIPYNCAGTFCASSVTWDNSTTTLANPAYTTLLNFRATSVASSAPTATLVTSAGNLTDGLQRYCVTFISKRFSSDTTFDDSNPTAGTALSETACVNFASITTDATHQQVSLTNIPLGPVGTTQRQIYRESPDSPGDPFSLDCAAVLNDNTTTTYTDNIAYGSTCNSPPEFDSAQGNFILDSAVHFNLQAILMDATSIYLNPVGNTATKTGTHNVLLVGGGINGTLTSGSKNTAVGWDACEGITTGSNNVCLGNFAGAGPSPAGTSNKLFIDASDTATSPLIGGDFTARTVDIDGSFGSISYRTATNCADPAGAAACGSAAAGAFVVDAASTSTVVSTTAVTTNSQIFVFFDAGLGTRLGITCNATVPTVYGVTARTAGVSFTLGATAPAVNPACFNYLIVN